MNAINFSDFSPIDLGGRLSSDAVAEALPDAAVVKAFNTPPAAVLAADPSEASGRRLWCCPATTREPPPKSRTLSKPGFRTSVPGQPQSGRTRAAVRRSAGGYQSDQEELTEPFRNSSAAGAFRSQSLARRKKRWGLCIEVRLRMPGSATERGGDDGRASEVVEAQFGDWVGGVNQPDLVSLRWL